MGHLARTFGGHRRLVPAYDQLWLGDNGHSKGVGRQTLSNMTGVCCVCTTTMSSAAPLSRLVSTWMRGYLVVAPNQATHADQTITEGRPRQIKGR